MMIADFFFELGSLKNTKRSGWSLIGIKDAESIAEHSFRTAVIGYVLAKLECADADKVMKLCLFHDIHEARTTDLHKLAQRYIEPIAAQRKAAEEQASRLPPKQADELMELFDEFHDKRTIDADIAKDADLLECAFQAKEYVEQGFPQAAEWMKSVRAILKTKSAKTIMEEMENRSSADWWKGLKNLGR